MGTSITPDTLENMPTWDEVRAFVQKRSRIEWETVGAGSCVTCRETFRSIVRHLIAMEHQEGALRCRHCKRERVPMVPGMVSCIECWYRRGNYISPQGDIVLSNRRESEAIPDIPAVISALRSSP